MDRFLALPIFHLPWWAYLAYCCSAVVVWFALYGLEAYLNSGSLGRHPVWFPFQCAWEELGWYLPGGTRRRINFVRERIAVPFDDGVMIGGTKAWHFSELRALEAPGSSILQRDKEFLACADDLLPGPFHFPLLMLAAILWPLALGALAVINIIAAMVPEKQHSISN